MNRQTKIIIITIITIAIIVGTLVWILSNERASEPTVPASVPVAPAVPVSKEAASEKSASEKIQQPAPTTYHIKGVPYYGERNFCYGASAMMLLKYNGVSEEEVQGFRSFVKKEGRGGPPDIFGAFNGYAPLEKINFINQVRIAYSRDYVKRYADLYNSFLDEPKKQTVLFSSRDEAFNYLKKLVSSDILVIAIVHYGNHYVIITGYDEDYVYTNDPGYDNGYTYKIDGGVNLEQRRISVPDFLDEWNISKQEKEIGGHIGFPGDYGMIWIDLPAGQAGK